MKNVKFYICPHCGNIVEMVNDAGVKPFCCGQKMQELVPGSVDASHEKHVPDVKVSEGVVGQCGQCEPSHGGSSLDRMGAAHYRQGQLPEVAEPRRGTQCQVPAE